MIRLSGRLICTTHAQARAVMMALPAHIRLTRAEPGCLSFDVVPTGDPLIWQVDEAFADRAAFDAHQARAAATDWATQTAGITRDYVITEASDA
ncbi:MAG: antibiotic biosynthesis monooxygenase [Paracoccaceae bacterium]|jgi:quinol monooxygenase YgiN|nr:antibiotic biosynthesis monooxygenase [Paracoccaceae bacterium]MDP5347580.1 antibiotic biosynthesis monooxygenase [Paracoccaceae bacterium]MDP5365030.1 antibiotic biosynthesis monooxygenase [Paracoccaceae bacterium]